MAFPTSQHVQHQTCAAILWPASSRADTRARPAKRYADPGRAVRRFVANFVGRFFQQEQIQQRSARPRAATQGTRRGMEHRSDSNPTESPPGRLTEHIPPCWPAARPPGPEPGHAHRPARWRPRNRTTATARPRPATARIWRGAAPSSWPARPRNRSASHRRDVTNIWPRWKSPCTRVCVAMPAADAPASSPPHSVISQPARWQSRVAMRHGRSSGQSVDAAHACTARSICSTTPSAQRIHRAAASAGSGANAGSSSVSHVRAQHAFPPGARPMAPGQSSDSRPAHPQRPLASSFGGNVGGDALEIIQCPFPRVALVTHENLAPG